jgi:hypothetical protein
MKRGRTRAEMYEEQRARQEAKRLASVREEFRRRQAVLRRERLAQQRAQAGGSGG